MNPLGVSPIAWANDDLRSWGPERSGEQIMAEMVRAGYAATEKSHTFPSDPQALRAALQRHGLVLVGAYRWANLAHPRLHEEEVEAARAHVDFCARAGAGMACFAEGTGSLHWDREGPRGAVKPLAKEGWSLLGEGLEELLRYGAERGVGVCFHPHGGTAVEGEAEIERLLEVCGVGLCLDTGHLAYAGADPARCARRWRSRVAHVHLKDLRGTPPGGSFLHAVRSDLFCMPGEGILDFGAVREALEGYTGWLVVEADQDPARHDPCGSARRAREYLEGLWR